MRNELNEEIVSQEYEVYYEKSLELDKLIAEYVDDRLDEYLAVLS